MPIKNSYIQLNTQPMLPINPTGTDDESFGVLVLEMKQINITKRPIFILFTLDTTGSMSEFVTHVTTKMQYAIQTLKSIVKYLSTENVDVYVQINTFNDDVTTIIPPTKVSAQTHTDMINTLSTIDAEGSTNIELALSSANASITEYATANPTHKCVHIFMTDGDPTSGATTPAELLNCVSHDYMSINIGFGIDHNAKLLCDLSNANNSEYHFIDNIEHASLVYGESLHKVLYPCLQTVRINIENGLIYDWLNNGWTSCITENTIVSEIKKFYHVKTATPTLIAANIEAYHECTTEDDQTYMSHINETVLRLPDLQDSDGNILHDPTIIRFAFRQSILEILYEAKNVDRYTNYDTVQNIKNQMKSIYDKLRTFTNENNMQNDGFVTQLLNDLYLAYWNIGMDNGEIYILGRYIAQANQHAYTPGNNRLHMHNINNGLGIPPTPIMRRFGHMRNQHSWAVPGTTGVFNSNIDLRLSTATSGMTDNEYSSYSTPGIRRTTTSIQSQDI